MKTLECHSIGSVACNLGVSVSRVERLATRLRLEPVLILDRVRHYSDEQVEVMREAMNKEQAK